MHTTDKFYVERLHEGTPPASWGTGDTFFQKAKFIAAVAWSFVKAPGDPELHNCDLTHQENLIGITESIMSGNKPDPTAFALKVKELITDLTPEDLRK